MAPSLRLFTVIIIAYCLSVGMLATTESTTYRSPAYNMSTSRLSLLLISPKSVGVADALSFIFQVQLKVAL